MKKKKLIVDDYNIFSIGLKLLNEKQIRDDIGLKGQEFIQKYNWDEIAENELKLWSDFDNKTN